ncbi:MAG: cytochrome c-type biogenesis protein CcmH, partial [Pseudoalteromonas sp.]
MKWLLLTLSIFVSISAFAEQDRYQFDNNKQAILFEELTKELRCP